MSKLEYGKEFLKLLDELEVTSPSEVLPLIKKINKETCVEMGVETISFFSDTFIVEKLVEIACKYDSDEKILVWFLRAITRISQRYNVNTPEIYDFLSKHIESNSNEIKFVVASRIISMPQFDKYEGKWDYIISTAKIPPKVYSMDNFLFVIEKKINEIPSDKIEIITDTLTKYINSSKLDITTHNRYVDVIEKLKRGFRNYDEKYLESESSH
ncbi:hypothetical protein [Lysinibacillus sp. G4S2]|uniref:hypothetical protein n=1 Tax=Lysinibacillus sp. G4S2 TaxID=3055859 RepID=UPI0025A168E8|nr:hypothetical protein [Lysinibacillus sp. G4S2]MDM5248898.1 hypothetical protein [Lysinibacillus sp. G4S2]